MLRCLLHGASAIEDGRRSSKSRRPHAQLWQVKQVTPSLLAFAATVVSKLCFFDILLDSHTLKIHFVLSGKSSFEESGSGVNYSDWYFARLQLIKAVHDRHQDAYDDLMHYYNREVFPTLYSQDGDLGRDDEIVNGSNGNAGMSAEDQAFLERL